jgi:4'-phosphopantetheinyl transferase
VRSLAVGDVDVWWGTLQAVDPVLLAPDELAELSRLRSVEDRRAFAARRTAVREVLAGYVALAPSELTFDRTCRWCGQPGHGKPRLCAAPGLSFSATSRHGVWMVAVAQDEMSVGVDLERLDDAAAADLHATVLTPSERDATEADDAPAVTRLWCRKEAVLKAQGVGLVRTSPDALDAGAPSIDGWHVRDVECPPGWVAAVAAAIPITHLQLLRWTGTPGGLRATWYARGGGSVAP